MDQVTQQNAAMAEQSNAAGATLAIEAGRLRELIGQFQLGNTSRQTSAVAAVDRHYDPVPSPARQIAGKVARVFNGNAALKECWEEF